MKYFEHRAANTYRRAYGNTPQAGRFTIEPQVVTDDNGALNPAIHSSRRRSSIASAVPPSPRPPVGVYRSRTMSDSGVEGVSHHTESIISTSKGAAAPCWYEWIVFDCHHGEQMMVQKFLGIMLEKAIEQSTADEDDYESPET